MPEDVDVVNEETNINKNLNKTLEDWSPYESKMVRHIGVISSLCNLENIQHIFIDVSSRYS